MRASLAVFAVLAAYASSGASAYLYPTHGAVAELSQSCLTDLNNIFNTYYLLTSTTPSQDNRTKPWFLDSPRRLGCRLGILEALQSSTSDNCPAEEQLVNCFWVAGKDWSTFVHKCELFKSQIPLPACSDAPGEAAEGVPSCSASDQAILNGNSGRRLMQAPANAAGMATWQYSFGEAAGLQYDPYAPASSPYAQPPVTAMQSGSGGSAAALAATSEGSEGADVSTGGSISGAAGCFPSFWKASDFDAWLNGNFKEIDRPKDYGGVNAIGLVSVLIYTIALSSLALF